MSSTVLSPKEEEELRIGSGRGFQFTMVWIFLVRIVTRNVVGTIDVVATAGKFSKVIRYDNPEQIDDVLDGFQSQKWGPCQG